MPVRYSGRARFEGRLAAGATGERTVEGWIIGGEFAPAIAVLGGTLATFPFVAGLLVVVNGDPVGLLSVAASLVFAGAILAAWVLQQRLADADAHTIVESLYSLGPVRSS